MTQLFVLEIYENCFMKGQNSFENMLTSSSIPDSISNKITYNNIISFISIGKWLNEFPDIYSINR